MNSKGVRASEHLAPLALAVIGAVVIFDAARISQGTTDIDPLGPRFFPFVTGAGLLIVAVLIEVQLLRGVAPSGEDDDEEDIDPNAKLNFKRVLLMVGLLIATAVVMDYLGWVIAGGAMFFLASLILGARRFWIALPVAVALGLITFYAFRVGLGVSLPVGILKGIL